MDEPTTRIVVRPPDSEVMSYSELRQWCELADWPLWLIDELAHGLAEQDETGDY